MTQAFVISRPTASGSAYWCGSDGWTFDPERACHYLRTSLGEETIARLRHGLPHVAPGAEVVPDPLPWSQRWVVWKARMHRSFVVEDEEGEAA